MRKRLVGVSLMAAASLFAVHPMDWVDKENQMDISVQQAEVPNPVSLVEKVSVIPDEQIPITLVDTIDGDTIKVKVKGKLETIRYLLVDTPESKNPRTCVQAYAQEAFQRNNQLVRDGSLTMEIEQGNTRDAYGRLLAYVNVNGKSVQETLIKEGFARVAYIMNPPYKYLSQYKLDESHAKRNKVNIWSRTGFVTNWGFSGCVP